MREKGSKRDTGWKCHVENEEAQVNGKEQLLVIQFIDCLYLAGLDSIYTLIN